MTSFRTRLIGGLAVLAASATLLAQDTIKYKWTKGETLRYRTTVTSDIAMGGIPGMDAMTLTMNQEQVNRLTTEAVAADGAGSVRTQFESVKMQMGTPMGVVGYDSANPNTASDPISEALRASMGALIGNSLLIELTPSGGVRKIEGMAAVLAKVNQAGGGAAMAAAGADQILSDDAMRSLFDQTYAILPDRPVKPGDTWKKDTKISNQFGALLSSGTFTLKGIETIGGRELTHVSMTATMSMAVGGGGTSNTPLGPMKVELGNGTGSAEIYFDHKLGRLQKTTATQNLPMTMSMTGPDGTPLNLTATTKTTTSVELIEK